MADQLLNNPESRRRQYALAMRARSVGWENVVVIDDDLVLPPMQFFSSSCPGPGARARKVLARRYR
jgi:hypothetical protein